MRETAVLFGEPKSLVGVVTDPIEPNGVAVLLLNAGFTHHVGPQRFYVRAARALARQGFTVLRFDHSGIGDSERRPNNLPFPDSVIKDAEEAMDFLQATRDIEKFFVGGICWGADNSLRVCSADARVVGVMAIDFYAVPSVRHLMRIYPPRLLSVHSWKNLLTARTGLFTAIQRIVGAAVSAVLARRKEGDDVLPSLPPAAVLANMAELIERGVHLSFAYASNAGSYDQYLGRFKKRMTELEKTGRLDVRVFRQADHLFTLRANQTSLVEHLVNWANETTRKLGVTPSVSSVAGA